MPNEHMSEDELERAIRALADAGEYRDELYGVPGTRIERAGAFRPFP